MSDSAKALRWSIERELQSLAVVERKTMIPMRDGIRVSADIYYPRSGGKYPIIWSRTPYNFHWFDIQNGVPRDMTAVLSYIKRGYAYVQMQERGRYWSEGEYDLLGAPTTDGEDEVRWLTGQPWSSGKIGATGCSSTAEWQAGVVARHPPGFAAMNVQGFGAGAGRVGPYYEQGNFYRGGALQMLFLTWVYGEQNPIRPTMTRWATREQLVQASQWFDLVPRLPQVDFKQALWTLPVMNILKAVGAPTGMFADSTPTSTGGAIVKRTPNDPAWYRGGLFHDNMRIDIPGLWFVSWYDISTGPNLEMYNHVRRTAGDAANQQWLVIAPTLHCAFRRSSAHTTVGQRDVGDARLNYSAIESDFFDKFLKGTGGRILDTMPKVLYYTMGLNKWQSSNTWPPANAQPMTFYLSSRGRANTLNGDGILSTRRPGNNVPADTFTYDPMNPVPSHGGHVCCMGAALPNPGSVDQRRIEERSDVLVYTTEPFAEGLEVTGPIVPTLYVSSDAKDTDFTIKIIDVYPDGRAYNIDESIQRLRYRNGYDKPLVWMERGKVYNFSFQPLVTSNYFAPGHRLRIEVSSSNFPRFDRNLNTGGNNYDEAAGVSARNTVHHSAAYPSSITLSVIKR